MAVRWPMMARVRVWKECRKVKGLRRYDLTGGKKFLQLRANPNGQLGPYSQK